MRSKARIAVVVPARDAMATLPACLDALMNSSCKPDEIIVFDDGLNFNIGKLAKPGLIKIVASDGKRDQNPRALLDFRFRSWIKYSRLATKLKINPAYPARIRDTWV